MKLRDLPWELVCKCSENLASKLNFKFLIMPEQKKWENLDSERIRSLLTREDGLGYIDLEPIWQEYFSREAESDESRINDPQWKENRESFIHLVEELLENNQVVLDEDPACFDKSDDKSFDQERQPVNTIVIHHTATADVKQSYINAIDFLRLYVPRFLRPDMKGQKIYSSHKRLDNPDMQTFIPYHFIIRLDGSIERCLADENIGWHAGNWGVNKESIALTIVGDFSNGRPPAEVIEALKNQIREYRRQNPGIKIIAHSQVPGTSTICPGNDALGENGWLHELIEEA